MKPKSINPLPKSSGGAVCVQWKKCGKSNCKCVRGALHGPYYAHFARRNGKLIKRYVRLSQAEQTAAQCQQVRHSRAAARRLAVIAQTIYADIKNFLRSSE